MNHLANQFIQYKKYSSDYPKEFTSFKYLDHSFILDCNSLSFPIYVLNTLHAQIISCTPISDISTWQPASTCPQLPFSAQVDLTLNYTCNNSTHSSESLTHIFSLLDTIMYPPEKVHLQLFIEDLFAYALDESHIYVHVLFLAFT